jgi:hypothetical protein
LKTIATLAMAGVILGLAAFGVACKSGGGGALTLEEYFQRFDEIQNNNDNALSTQEASVEDPSADASEKDLADLLRNILLGVERTLRNTADEADAVKEPDEVKDEHGDMVDAVNGAADALGSAADEIPDEITLAELQSPDTLFNAEAITTAFDELTTACTALQQIADDNQIDVDLECEA